MLTAIVVFLFVLAALIERMTILKNEKNKVKVLHFSIMLVSFCVLILYSLNIPLPSPTDAITNVLEAVFKLKS